MSKFTKGPWVKDYNGTVGHIKSINPDLEPIDSKTPYTPTVCRYDRSALCIRTEEREANARLIAAAPEMYEMLVKLCEIAESDSSADAMDGLTDLLTNDVPQVLLAKIKGGK